MKPFTTTKTSKFRNVLLLLLVVFLFLFVFYQNVYKREAVITRAPLTVDQILGTREETIAGLDDKYAGKTIEYYDQDFGFSILYPIGYSAVQEPAPGIKARFSAYSVPFQAEIFDVRLLNYSDITAGDIRNAAKESKATVLEGKQNARPFYAYTAFEESAISENETLLVRQAFLECRDLDDKPYWLSFTAAFTSALTPDLELAEYMISSVKC